MNFNLPAGRLKMNLWDERPVRDATLPEGDQRMKPWWNSGMTNEETGELRADHVSHFGDLRPSADQAMSMLSGIDYNSYIQKVLAIEHEFAVEAHLARIDYLRRFRGPCLSHATHQLTTPSMFGTTPSTREPLQQFIQTVLEVEDRNKKRLRQVNEREKRL